MDVSVCIRDIEKEALRLLRFLGVKNVDLRPYFMPHSWKEFHKKDMNNVSKIEEIKAKMIKISKVLKENGFNISTVDSPPIQWFFMNSDISIDEKIKEVVEYYKDFIAVSYTHLTLPTN